MSGLLACLGATTGARAKNILTFSASSGMDENAINAEKTEKQPQACSVFPQVLNLGVHLDPALFH